MNTSILSKPVIDDFLRTAQGNLKDYGYLEPVCFLKLTSGAVTGIALRTLGPRDTVEEREKAMLKLRRQVYASGATISEAVMILETWYLDHNDVDTGSRVAPSKHRARKEAIVIVGRNANNTRATMLMQSFQRDGKNRPVWGKQPVAYYNQPPGNDYRFGGLLDYLFPETSLN